MDSADRILPHNLEAERSVLGAILLDADAFPVAAQTLGADDFYRDAHRRVFRGMLVLNARGEVIDGVTLTEELMRAGDLDEVGGPAFVALLSNGVPRSTNVKYYARIVKEKSTLRGLIDAAHAMIESSYEQDASPSVVDAGVRQLLSLSSVRDSGVVTMGAASQTWVASLEGDGTSVSTGFVDLDEILGGGFRYKQLVMLAARPSMGKTTLLLNLAERIATAGVPAAIFTLEMEPAALAEGAIARTARIDAPRMRSRALAQHDWGRLAEALETLNDLKLYLVERASSLAQIEAWCRRLRAEHDVRFFGLDYIQKAGDIRARDRRLEIDFISSGLARIAKDLDVVFVALSQLTRAPEQRADKRPQLGDLKESGALEADADVVLLIFRPDAYDRDPENPDAGIAEVIVAKNRSGPVGVAKLAFLREQLRFENLARS